MDKSIDITVPKPRRLKRSRIESVFRIGMAPMLTSFSQRHFPEIKPEMLQDLTDGVADYIATSFESYQDDIEAEQMEFAEYNEPSLPLEKCTMRNIIES